MKLGWPGLYIGFLGLAFLGVQLASLILSSRARPQIDDNPLKQIHRRGAVIAGRCFVAAGLMLVAGMPSYGFLDPLLSPARTILNMIGPLYFPVSLLLDLSTYVQLHRRERCGEDGLIAYNFLCIPFTTLAATLLAFRTGSRSGEPQGIRIGYVVKLLRRVIGQATISSVNQPVKIMGERWEVRSAPKNMGFKYDPEALPNPHIGVFGASGQGKTTHTLYLMYMLSKKYRLIVFDLKGDFSESARARGWIERGLAEVIDVQKLGINPLVDRGDSLRRLNSVVRLIEAISAIEDLGSNQKAVLISAVEDLNPFTYEEFKKRVEAALKRAMKGKEGGPHIRDAYTGLYNRIRLSSSVFRSDGRINEHEMKLSWKGPPIEIYNISGIADERLRALAAEWMLRVIYEKARERGAVGFLREDKVFLVVDEAHELARAQRWRRDMTRSILEDLARKGRSYGVNLIIITQRLSDLADGLRSNCSGMWIIFRDVAPLDISILSSLTSCPIIGQVLSNLKVGEALILKSEPQVLDRLRVAYDRPVTVTVAAIVKTARLKLKSAPAGRRGNQVVALQVALNLPEATQAPTSSAAGSREQGEKELSDLVKLKLEVCRRIKRPETKAFVASLGDEDFKRALMRADRAKTLSEFVKPDLAAFKRIGLVQVNGRPTIHCRLLYKACKEVLREGLKCRRNMTPGRK